jgi:hypothetical protein
MPGSAGTLLRGADRMPQRKMPVWLKILEDMLDAGVVVLEIA